MSYTSKLFSNHFRTLGLLIFLFSTSAVNASPVLNFISPQKTSALGGQNSMGFGYYHEPIVYFYRNRQKENFVSDYKGYFVKLVHNAGDNLAFHAQYLQAQGKDLLWSLGGSVVYGFNLNKPGLGFYAGMNYSLKSRSYLAGERFMEDKKHWGYDFPIGIQVQNSLFTFSVETRYRAYILEGDDVGVESSSYPLYFGVLLNF